MKTTNKLKFMKEIKKQIEFYLVIFDTIFSIKYQRYDVE